MNIERSDCRTEDQKVAAVRASMTMAGYAIPADVEQPLRGVIREEISGDHAALGVIERAGLGDTDYAESLRERLTQQTTHGEGNHGAK